MLFPWKQKEQQKIGVFQRIGNNVHKIAIGLMVFSFLALSLTVISSPDFFRADVTASTDVCNVYNAIASGQDWESYFLGLPSKTGPEDDYGVLTYKITCSENDGCPVSEECDPDATGVNLCDSEGYKGRNSLVKSNTSIPFSTYEAELIFLGASTGGKAKVTGGGDTISTDDGVKAVINTGNVLQDGEVLSIGSGQDINNLNLSLYLSFDTDLSSGEAVCGMALFNLKTDYRGEVHGKVTGTDPDEANGIPEAKVTLKPCPVDDQDISTIPPNATCDVYTDAQGDYSFPSVLPRRDPYEVSAVRAGIVCELGTDLVCGADGLTTYSTPCEARDAGETNYTAGACCGNGAVELGEQCDDGNKNSGDGCSSSCQLEQPVVCGNGVVEAGEQCDDGNTTSGDGCSSSCQSE